MSTPLPPRPSGPGADAHGSATTGNSAPAQATHGTLAIQLRDIERQAGVRRTL